MSNLAILYPTSLANLVVKVGTRHSHQILLGLQDLHLQKMTLIEKKNKKNS